MKRLNSFCNHTGQWLTKRPWWQVQLLVLLGLMLVYFTSLPDTATGIADADELVASAWLGVLAHPPGYPVWLAILQLAQRWLVWNSVYQAAGLMTSLVSAAAVWWLMSTMRLWLRQAKQLSQSQSTWLAAAAGLTWGLASLTWQYSVVPEVLALSWCLSFAWLYWLVFGHYFAVRRTRLVSLITGVLLGLLLAHHQLAVVLLPVWLRLSWKQSPNNRVRFFLLVTLGMILGWIAGYGLMFHYWQAADRTGLGWQIDGFPHNWWQIYTRQVFDQGLSADSRGAYWKGIHWVGGSQTVWHWLTVILPQNFSWPNTLLIGWGIILLLIRGQYKRLDWWLLWLVLQLGLIFYLPLNFDSSYWLSRALAERMVWLLAAVWLWFWLEGLLWWFQKIKSLPWQVLLIVSLLIIQLFNSGQQLDLPAAAHWSEKLKSEWLALPANSRLICFSDWSCFALYYYQQVEQLRPDIDLIAVTPALRLSSSAETLYPDNPFRLGELVAKGLADSDPVAVAETDGFYQQVLGVRLSSQPTANLIQLLSCQPNQQLVEMPVDLPHLTGGSYTHLWQAESKQQFGITGVDLCNPLSQLLAEAEKCQLAGNQLCTWIKLNQAVWTAPQDLASRQALAQFYQQQQQLELAKREWQILLYFYPDYLPAQTAMQQLKSVKALPVNLPDKKAEDLHDKSQAKDPT